MKRLVSLLSLLTLGSALMAQPPPTPAVPPSQHDIDYAFGLLIGQSLAATGMTFDLDVLRQALQDATDKTRTPLLTLERAKQIVNDVVRANQQKATQALVDKEKTYLANHAKQPGVITTASGLQYEVLKAGTGPKPVATDQVKVDYVGTLADGTEFDSSIKRGEPAEFTLDQVIPGWTEGLQLMAVGGKYRLTVPSSLAYGPQGAGGGVIPPYATLVFVVDFLAIEPPAPEAKDPQPKK